MLKSNHSLSVLQCTIIIKTNYSVAAVAAVRVAGSLSVIFFVLDSCIHASSATVYQNIVSKRNYYHYHASEQTRIINNYYHHTYIHTYIHRWVRLMVLFRKGFCSLIWVFHSFRIHQRYHFFLFCC